MKENLLSLAYHSALLFQKSVFDGIPFLECFDSLFVNETMKLYIFSNSLSKQGNVHIVFTFDGILGGVQKNGDFSLVKKLGRQHLFVITFVEYAH